MLKPTHRSNILVQVKPEDNLQFGELSMKSIHARSRREDALKATTRMKAELNTMITAWRVKPDNASLNDLMMMVEDVLEVMAALVQDQEQQLGFSLSVSGTTFLSLMSVSVHALV